MTIKFLIIKIKIRVPYFKKVLNKKKKKKIANNLKLTNRVEYNNKYQGKIYYYNKTIIKAPKKKM